MVPQRYAYHYPNDVGGVMVWASTFPGDVTRNSGSVYGREPVWTRLTAAGPTMNSDMSSVSALIHVFTIRLVGTGPLLR